MLDKHVLKQSMQFSALSLKGRLIRAAWFAFGGIVFARRYVVSPQSFRTVRSYEDVGVDLEPLIETYGAVFRESPAWNEDHSADEVDRRLRNALGPPASLSLWRGDGETPVAGFCWGQVTTVGSIIKASRDMPSFVRAYEHQWLSLEHTLNSLIGNRDVLYVHELGILTRFRRGLAPVQFLFRPILEMAVKHGVHSAVWWTSRRSEAYQLSKAIGFEPIGEVGDQVFLYTPDFRSVLRVIQRCHSRDIAKLMRYTSRRRRNN